MVLCSKRFIASLEASLTEVVVICGWILHLRELARTTFIVVKDCSGQVQCVVASELVRDLKLKLDEPLEIRGKIKPDKRAKLGFELEVIEINVLNQVSILPFNSSSDISDIGIETILAYRPLSLRHSEIGDIFRIQAAILQYFRQFLGARYFTEIVTSKIVSSGTEGGTNLFEIKYFERLAYLAQSPQFYKEYGVSGLERVFETGYVYRAEPHASSRHLTEYYSLDLEMGFINSAEEVIELERELLTFIFEQLNQNFADQLKHYRTKLLPSMLNVPTWEFTECLKLLNHHFGRNDLIDDLDPEAERQLCQLAEAETGVAALFVIGFPLSARPFYTYPRGHEGASQSFDLLFEGIEITTGGKRLHKREDLKQSLTNRNLNPASFENHLQMFELGMPPHGGLAIGLERLTSRILNLPNVRQASLYPRDRYRITP
ncbi:aspartate--tRNA(Asn) ligase [Dulcicalothrix desertica PCC 7102]|uniref:Aspartate--tRNA(Asn) ligase n=1 Tax=Dulcicalothrix desertica PCC 7102 TaxID=232991 RepID=A0A433VFH9_9CYAN|nr:aspartate--tRNA(Asn) ligase [Dulcicalothrix desertica]RUT04817.1 aspartate--tRNA(Asn) ligase [Dulcicalothrix desertica PCC 7102]TWH42829.1 nondiscriminating aspartyl-tRNA synthetase [Dulcicalothrix desertica PCC 7102]